MISVFKPIPSLQKPSHACGATRAAQCLADADLATIAGGIEPGTIRLEFGLRFGAADKALPFSAGLQQLPVGAVDAPAVPWAELKPAVKKLQSDNAVIL